MSIKVMAWVWSLDIEAWDKLVLMALADHSDDDGLCWPGIKGIAQKTRISERAVQQHVQSLREAKLLDVQPQYRPDGGLNSSFYRLLITPVSPPGFIVTPPGDTSIIWRKVTAATAKRKKEGRPLP